MTLKVRYDKRFYLVSLFMATTNPTVQQISLYVDFNEVGRDPDDDAMPLTQLVAFREYYCSWRWQRGGKSSSTRENKNENTRISRLKYPTWTYSVLIKSVLKLVFHTPRHTRLDSSLETRRKIFLRVAPACATATGRHILNFNPLRDRFTARIIIPDQRFAFGFAEFRWIEFFHKKLPSLSRFLYVLCN